MRVRIKSCFVNTENTYFWVTGKSLYLFLSSFAGMCPGFSLNSLCFCFLNALKAVNVWFLFFSSLKIEDPALLRIFLSIVNFFLTKILITLELSLNRLPMFCRKEQATQVGIHLYLGYSLKQWQWPRRLSSRVLLAHTDHSREVFVTATLSLYVYCCWDRQGKYDCWVDHWMKFTIFYCQEGCLAVFGEGSGRRLERCIRNLKKQLSITRYNL